MTATQCGAYKRGRLEEKLTLSKPSKVEFPRPHEFPVAFATTRLSKWESPTQSLSVKTTLESFATWEDGGGSAPLSRVCSHFWLLGNSAEGGPQNCSLLQLLNFRLPPRFWANQFCVFLKD